jgi:hypothetical protein
VDDHDECLVGHLRKGGGHGLRPRPPTGHAGDDLGGRELLREKDRRLLPAGRRSDDDRVDEIAAIKPIEALGQKRATTERGERLGTIDSEPLARAGGGDQRKDTSAFGGNV